MQERKARDQTSSAFLQLLNLPAKKKKHISYNTHILIVRVINLHLGLFDFGFVDAIFKDV